MSWILPQIQCSGWAAKPRKRKTPYIPTMGKARGNTLIPDATVAYVKWLLLYLSPSAIHHCYPHLAIGWIRAVDKGILRAKIKAMYEA